MTGDCHVRFREGLGGKLPRSTRRIHTLHDRQLLDNLQLNRDRKFGTFAFARHETQPTCKSKRAKSPRSFLLNSTHQRAIQILNE